jgi:hypothetical protein
MSVQIGAVLDGFVYLEAVVLRGIEVLHVLEHNPFPSAPGSLLSFK